MQAHQCQQWKYTAILSCIFIVTLSVDKTVRCKSLAINSNDIIKNNIAKETLVSGRHNLIADFQKWTPLKDYKGPLAQQTPSINSNSEVMKTSESILKPMNILSSPQQKHDQLSIGEKLLDSKRKHNGQHSISNEQQLPFDLLRFQHFDEQQQSEASTLNTVSSGSPADKSSHNHGDNDDYDDDDDDNNNEIDGNDNEQANNVKLSTELMHGNESVTLESTIEPPINGRNNRWSRQQQRQSNQNYPRNLDQQATTGNRGELLFDEGPEQQQSSNEDAEAQERSEQEAAEASEAEAADRSALDEQQQQQREIIMAQAQSEAKAIKEQQEALLRQTLLQQQMVLRRQHDLDVNQSDAHLINSPVDRRKVYRNNNNSNRQQQRATNHQTDIQFSDQPDNLLSSISDQSTAAQQENNHDEVGEYSIRQAAHSAPTAESTGQLGLVSSDLVPAAQHHYGSHYDSLKGHQKDYYQFAESHKKGQFDSGFKRGGKKFQISGHSSQHKSHAEGHVKWHGKKGKGTHYWDYKHKDKKHYAHYGQHHY